MDNSARSSERFLASHVRRSLSLGEIPEICMPSGEKEVDTIGDLVVIISLIDWERVRMSHNLTVQSRELLQITEKLGANDVEVMESEWPRRGVRVGEL